MNRGHLHAVGQIAVSALIYLAVDLPFSLTGFPGTQQLAGPSAGVALLLGLLAGRTGAVGCVVGAGVAAALSEKAGIFILIAAAGVASLALIPYTLWYAKQEAEQVSLRSGRDFLKYTLILAVGAAGNAFFALFLGGPGAVFPAFAFTLFWGLVEGAPLLILLISILGVRPACPARARQEWDLELIIPPEIERIGEVNDRIEELGMEKGLNRKEMFRLMACLEEILLRVLQNAQVSGNIEICILARETVMVRITYSGNRYNPLHMNREEEMEDLAGLKIFLQMSLRASWRRRGENKEIRIVV